MTDDFIAIVGASCRFPGADDLEKFWQLLISAGDAISEVDHRRWSTRFFYHPDRSEPGKSYTWSAGLITGVDLFEPSFFGISPREAAQMDPQQRVLLELVWHAFEDAGIPPSKMAGSATGVYIGASATDYSDLRLGDPAGADSYFMTGSTLSILANRISYIFDLRGPSLAIDTACSSSLVALHHACEAIRDNRIASAVVGGINLLLAPYPFIGFSRASMLSKRGRCFAFDERADGYVRGEGGAVVILKRLADAVADNDPIRAVIRASGINSDGRTIGLSLPSESAQSSLLRAIYRGAGITADELAFFEMHGTGTAAGDPIEAAAVGRALGQDRASPLPIGSVKTNIGHLEPASGMAGLLKTALALDRETIPPTIHCETPNPKIPFGSLNLRLIRNPEPAVVPAQQYAGVNSFGFGGTNAHVVLAKSPPRGQTTESSLPPLVISAQSEASLRSLAESWRALLAELPPRRAVPLLRAAARGRDQHPHRLITIASEPIAITRSLAGFVADEPSPGVLAGTAVREGALAFVFSGNGAQFAGMGRGALLGNAAFRGAVEGLDRVLRPELGWSLAELLATGADDAALARADVAQPLLFAVQVGIVEALRDVGVAASAHVGHSVGEIAAAWAAGALTLAEAGRVVIARSRHQQRTQGAGRMAALALAPDAASELLDAVEGSAEVAACNGTQSVTVSGTAAEIERVGVEAKRRGLWFRELDLDFAFHSRQMDPIREGLLDSLTGLSSRPPTARLVSTVTGEAIKDASLDASHWWHNIRKPVRFAEAAARLIEAGCRIFLEIGPTAILQSYLTDALRAAKADGRVLATLSRKPVEGDPFPTIAANCFVAGYDLTGSAQFDGTADPRGLPLYSWDRQCFWFGQTPEAADPVNPPFDHPLLGFRQRGPIPYWTNHLDEQLLPWIADHAIEGVPVLPAAGVLEMACAAARLQWPDMPVLEIRDVEVRRPLPFDKGRMREIRTVITSEEGDWELASRPRLSNEPLTQHAVGRIGATADLHRIADFPDEISARRRIGRETLYELAREAGLNYGVRFRTVNWVEISGPTQALAALDPSPNIEDVGRYLVHPALLDGALQALLALLAGDRDRVRGRSFLPWRFDRARFLAPFGRIPRHARVRVTRRGTRSVSADIELSDADGKLIAELADCWFRRIELTRGDADHRCLRIDLIPAPLTEASSPALLQELGRAISRNARARDASLEQREQALLMNALVASIAHRSMSHVAQPDRPFTIAELVEAGSLAPAAAPIAGWALRLLARFDAAAETSGEWQVRTASGLPDVEELWRLLLADAPDLVAELALTAAAVERLPQALAVGPAASDTSLVPMMEHLLHASPSSAASLSFLCTALEEIAAAWPRGRPLRILEVGAVGGGATRRVLDCLARTGATVDYRAANDDAEQVARLSFLAESFTGVTAFQWTPAESPEALDQAQFDIILAVNACARLMLDRAGLSSLRGLLAPGGIFVATEPEPNPLWDLIFGQDPQWWAAASHSSDGSPLRSGEEWCEELAAVGFGSTDATQSGGSAWPSSIFWGMAPQRHEASASERESPHSAVAIVGEGALALALQDSLSAAGWQAWCAGPAKELPGNALYQARGDKLPLGIVLFLVESGTTSDPIASASREIAALGRLAGDAAEHGSELWIVTCGAQQVAEPKATQAGPVGGCVWSFARVLANEMPRLSLRLVDLPTSVSVHEHATQITCELAASGDGDEVVWTPEGRHVLRVRRGLPSRLAKTSAALTLRSQHPGGLDSLGWESAAPQPVGPGQVEVEVHAAGLNFRDMMWAMGLLPEEALIDGFAGPTFGLECAGVIRSVGPDVEGWKPGDRVMGFAPAALSTRVVTMADALAPIPPEMSFAAAATVPVTFVTATYALGHLANLARGEHVLIHAAAGGVGLAAIQYAKLRGAVVIATAGSEVKRAFLRLAGADHVLDSRGLEFCSEIRDITAGQGIDIVLNSLSGEAMERSLEVLKPFGRFLELGKRDLYLNRRIHLRPLRQNISYFAIDIDQLPIRRPDLARDLLTSVSVHLAKGEIRPLAHRVFSFGELDDAIRLMQSSGHIGKLVLEPRSNAGVRVRGAPPVSLRRDGTYLVTGGIEGFGFEAARWLAAHGAGSIALIGRRGADTPGCDARIGELEAAGAAICVFSGDTADRARLAEVLDEIRALGPPLRGVVHAASSIDDGLVSELDEARLEAVLRPKLGGALALDALTRDDPLELFLLFSSATALVGAPAQGAYVAANAALEALARRRRSEGRPALAIAWGPISDAGYLAVRPETRDALARRLGAKPLPAAEALAGLPALLASGLPAIAFAETDWSEARRFLPILATPLFSEVRTRGSASPFDESLGEQLANLDPDAALALLKTVVAEEAATILRLPASGIDPLRPLSEMGMDSLMAVELRLALEGRLRVDLPLVSLAEGTSVASIAARLAAAISTAPKEGELLALVARHEGLDEQPFPPGVMDRADAAIEPNPVAAE